MNRSSQQPKDRLGGDRRLAVGIFFLVLAVYVLTYDGSFISNDERALFSGTDSFVKRGLFTTNQIYWDYTNVGMLTTAGDMVPNYEPAQMVLAIPFYVWGWALGAAVQGVMFFGAVAMAGTAALIYLCLLELGYSRRTGTLGALVFAFATAAWPYSRTFFREPVTILAYMAAFYGLLRYRPPGPRRLGWPALTGTALGLALTTKQISIAIIPSLALLAVVYEWRRPAAPGKSQRRERTAAALAALIPFGIIWLLGRIYTETTLHGIEMFARNIADYATNPQLSTSDLGNLIYAGLGLTISPYKGLFWYSPAVLLGLIGAVPFLRRYRWEGLALLGAAGAHVLGYSRYLYWSGGVAWGSRYMLQVVPFLVLLSAPIFAWLLRESGPVTSPLAPPRHGEGSRSGTFASPFPFREGDQKDASVSPFPHRDCLRAAPRQGGRGGRFAVCLLIGLSVAIQVLGISLDVRTYEVSWLLDQAKVWGGVGEAIQALYMVPYHSPVLGHLRLLLSGTQPLDFAWVQLREQGQWALVPAGLALSLAAVGLAVGVFVWLWRTAGRAGAWAGMGMSAAMLVICSGLLLIYRQGDARFDPYGVDRFLQPMQGALAEATGPGSGACQKAGWLGPLRCNDVLVVPDPVLTDYFLNYLRPSLPWYDIYDQQPEPVDTRLLDLLIGRYGRIWLARDRSADADDSEGRRQVERYLSQHAYKIDEQKFGEGGWARLLQYSAAGTLAEAITGPQSLGEMTLVTATLGIQQPTAQLHAPAAGAATAAPDEPLDDGKVGAHTGNTLQISLHWRAEEKPAANYTVFVQLLNDASQVAAQSDRWPGDGLYPTAAMEAGQVITDNLALRLDVPSGQYHLIAGMYRNDVEGAPRLAGPGGDFLTLAEVDVP